MDEAKTWQLQLLNLLITIECDTKQFVLFVESYRKNFNNNELTLFIYLVAQTLKQLLF